MASSQDSRNSLSEEVRQRRKLLEERGVDTRSILITESSSHEELNYVLALLKEEADRRDAAAKAARLAENTVLAWCEAMEFILSPPRSPAPN